jgi:NAD-dependent dihydropyrimidine dehydrogenase PreA subunit
MLETNYGPRIDYQLCTGCGECYECCPMDVFGWDCVCETVCPEIAIDVEIPLHARIDFGIYPKRATK